MSFEFVRLAIGCELSCFLLGASLALLWCALIVARGALQSWHVARCKRAIAHTATRHSQPANLRYRYRRLLACRTACQGLAPPIALKEYICDNKKIYNIFIFTHTTYYYEKLKIFILYAPSYVVWVCCVPLQPCNIHTLVCYANGPQTTCQQQHTRCIVAALLSATLCKPRAAASAPRARHEKSLRRARPSIRKGSVCSMHCIKSANRLASPPRPAEPPCMAAQGPIPLVAAACAACCACSPRIVCTLPWTLMYLFTHRSTHVASPTLNASSLNIATHFLKHCSVIL